jgi:nitrogen fixation-related uncharacterized protein
MRRLTSSLVTLLLMGGVALADHVPGVGFDYKGTWVVVIAVGVIFSLLVLSLLWAFLDGQFDRPERIKHLLTQPDNDWPFGRGTSIERPEPETR